MPDFRMTAEIDGNGVVLAVLEGQFSAEKFLRQRRLVFESRFAPEDYDGRPVVTDLRGCSLPRREWAAEFRDIARYLRSRRVRPFRHAVVVGDEPGAETAVALFAEYQKIFHHPAVETLAFKDFPSAYAWATEGLGSGS